ncbi:hypothetical protein [Vibrio barjaei]|uniref:hypothetical protein n=1 Tax=Vibrio barjaei TaxID=1676683 RepID=UPI00228490B2|nr:hypothetical protein [Vibrio barjaei]MCY9870468.1 hypothetical protein [Vibrio barjaei]
MNQLKEQFDALPKAITIYDEVIAYVESNGLYFGLSKTHQGGVWVETLYDRSEIAALVDDVILNRVKVEVESIASSRVVVLDEPLSIKALSSQLEEHGQSYGSWESVSINGKVVGYHDRESGVIALYEAAQITKSFLPSVQVDWGMSYVEGVTEMFKPSLMENIKYGLAPFEVDAESAPFYVTKLKEWDVERHQRQIEL